MAKVTVGWARQGFQFTIWILVDRHDDRLKRPLCVGRVVEECKSISGG